MLATTSMTCGPDGSSTTRPVLLLSSRLSFIVSLRNQMTRRTENNQVCVSGTSVLAFELKSFLASDCGGGNGGSTRPIMPQSERSFRNWIICDGLRIAVHNHPVKSTKGSYRVNLRHGVSRVRSGERHTRGHYFSRCQIAKAECQELRLPARARRPSEPI
jgi:hypothetical protein